MTSVGVKIDNSVTRQSGSYCFKIQGELHHLTGVLLPHGDQTPIYAQIYILDTAEQLNVKRANNNNLDPVVIDNLQTMLLDNRDVVLQAKGGQLERISQNSPLYSALHYVLLFPKGENGWYLRIPIRDTQLREQGENARQRNGEERARSQVVSDTCYYAYRLHVRDGP